MSLKDIPYKSLYFSPEENFVDEVLVRSFKQAVSVDCMFGFFSSAALRSIAPGLSEYLSRDASPMRLLVSPNISAEDMSSLREGVASPATVIEERLKQLLGEAKISTSALVKHTLTCLAYMLAHQKLEFRVAWLRNGSLFHPKVWCFMDAKDTVVAHGSSNFTDAALGGNFEQISVDMSWEGNRSKETIEKLVKEFHLLWDGTCDYVLTLDLSVAIKNELIREYQPNQPPTLEDFKNAWESDAEVVEALVSEKLSKSESSAVQLVIPPHLELDSGPYSHQGRAITAWEKAGRRGILSMATGSGKTITALAAASKLQKEVDSLLIIVSAPYKPLVSQWMEEFNQFGVNALPIGGTAVGRAHKLYLAGLGLQAGVKKIEVMVVTENFLTSDEFRKVFDDLPLNITTLLIADEAHNLGRRSFITNTPERFDYRLGLSATPERQYDPEGSTELFNYFGPTVFEFDLKEAIGVCLVPYNYHIHKVSLSDDEYTKWIKLTEQLSQQNFSGDADVSDTGNLPEAVKRLLVARRRVIESADSKVAVLRNILSRRPRDQIKHALVYTTDKNRNQLNSVNDMLQNDLNLIIHQLTSEETSNRARSADILERFATGDYHALTCMRVLDEGVDIPQVSEAFILASNTVRRQWIQRRGRILRKCGAINKQIANLHDFIVVPPDPSDKRSRQILKGELARASEFSELSANAGTPGGPLDEITNLTTAMFD